MYIYICLVAVQHTAIPVYVAIVSKVLSIIKYYDIHYNMTDIDVETHTFNSTHVIYTVPACGTSSWGTMIVIKYI